MYNNLVEENLIHGTKLEGGTGGKYEIRQNEEGA
jgi:hypothetical protein